VFLTIISNQERIFGIRGYARPSGESHLGTLYTSNSIIQRFFINHIRIDDLQNASALPSQELRSPIHCRATSDSKSNSHSIGAMARSAIGRVILDRKVGEGRTNSVMSVPASPLSTSFSKVT
jgi:hypothetical protein